MAINGKCSNEARSIIMECAISYRDNVGLIRLTGRMDTPAATLFDAWFIEHDKQGCCHFIIELADVSYITSAGLRSILKLCKLLEGRGGKLVVCSATQPVQDLFKISGFTTFLACYNSLDEALSAQTNSEA
jgi:anti-sigma B factor antagonist